MKTFVRILVTLDILNLLAFATLQSIAAAHHLHQPGPRWFRQSTLACFYSALILCLVSFHALASRAARKQALLSILLAIASACFIAFRIGR
jgi:hypothetical protein